MSPNSDSEVVGNYLLNYRVLLPLREVHHVNHKFSVLFATREVSNSISLPPTHEGTLCQTMFAMANETVNGFRLLLPRVTRTVTYGTGRAP